MLDWNSNAIRFYEKIGLLKLVDRRPNGYRTYPQEAVVMLELINSAQQAGFSLDEIRALSAFYATPEGRGILLKMQPFLEGAMAEVATDIQAAQGVILQRTFDALRSAQ